MIPIDYSEVKPVKKAMPSAKEQLHTLLALLESLEGKTKEQMFYHATRQKALAEALDEVGKLYREQLLRTAEQTGTKQGNNFVVMLPDGGGWRKEVRVSLSLDKEKAIALAKSKGLDNLIAIEERLSKDADLAEVANIVKQEYPDWVCSEETVSESDLEEAVYSGKLTVDELRGVLKEKVVNALTYIKNG